MTLLSSLLTPVLSLFSCFFRVLIVFKLKFLNGTKTLFGWIA
jgi:hypothetical protein